MSSPLRPYEPRDRDALYDVCLRTADGGGDATALYDDPRLLGDVWVGPYVTFEPELALVLDDGSGPGGYVLGALDTRAFEARCAREWWPALRRAHPLDGAGRVEGGGMAEDGPDARAVALLHRPPISPDSVVRSHPSHLHIDLLPQWQGGGWGRRLIAELLQRLSAAGSPGVHLGVSADNVRARGFYAHLGFTELHVVEGTHFLGRSTR
ncbi:MAG: hypothetical protein JWP82_319 [Humibacillus sp.]|nr:hypothetical protein [Humibacillus sp.]